MYESVQKFFPEADIFVSAGAVADYRPVSYSSSKIKKGQDSIVLEMSKTKDILKEMSNIKKPRQHLVGFAVETDDPEKNARAKLKNKKMDMIVLNNPLTPGAGFGPDTNEVTLLYADGTSEQIPKTAKQELAYMIVERAIGILEGSLQRVKAV